MGKRTRMKNGKMSQDESVTDFRPEKELINNVLNTFKQTGTNALVIMENEESMCVLSNGISGEALGSF